MPVEHYENFPVASWLLPARLRSPVEAIYDFARTADDFADEGDIADTERIARLEEYASALDRIGSGERHAGPVLARLHDVIREHDLPLQPFRDLLDAFRQDVVKRRYETYDELMDYCRRSANPVGRLLLHLFGQADSANLSASDAICSSLQLINFWQDVAVDWAKGRMYLPREDLARFGVGEWQIEQASTAGRWSELLAFECARTRTLMQSGAPLGARLPGRLGLEIRAIVEAGTAILDKVDRVGGDVFRHRPVLRRADWPRILWRAFLGSGVRT